MTHSGIAIAVYNGANIFAACLESMADLSATVVLFDDGIIDVTADVARRIRSDFDAMFDTLLDVARDQVAQRELVDVEVVPLDRALESRGIARVDFVRSDVEGYEYEVLEGAPATVERCHPTFLLEPHPHMEGLRSQACLDFFSGGGYRFFNMAQNSEDLRPRPSDLKAGYEQLVAVQPSRFEALGL